MRVVVFQKLDFASVVWLSGGSKGYIRVRQLGRTLTMLCITSLDVEVCADECDDAKLTMQLKRR